MPEQHSSVVGGSNAHLVLACNASIDMRQGLPPEPWSIYSATGTALHGIMEVALKNWLSDEQVLVEYVGVELEGVKITEALLRAKVLPALAWFEGQFPETVAFETEQRVGFEGLIPGAFGTSDVVFTSPDRAGIVDWKFGDNHIVSAEDNDQMRFYLAAAVHSGSLPVRGCYEAWIYQPSSKLKPQQFASRGLYSRESLERFSRQLERAIRLDRVQIPGEHCRWCKGKVRCPAFAQMMTADMATDVPGLTANELSRRLGMLESLEAYIREVRETARRNALSGVPIPGWHLETAQGNRRWVDEDSADGALMRLGLPVADRVVKSLITPAEAERRLKKLETPAKAIDGFMKRHVERPDNGVKLVKQTVPGADAFVRLGQQLKAVS